MAFIQATRVAATRVKVLSGERQRGMCLSCLQYPLLCRNSGGERHTCVHMTAWPLSHVLALVLFLVLSIISVRNIWLITNWKGADRRNIYN